MIFSLRLWHIFYDFFRFFYIFFHFSLIFLSYRFSPLSWFNLPSPSVLIHFLIISVQSSPFHILNWPSLLWDNFHAVFYFLLSALFIVITMFNFIYNCLNPSLFNLHRYYSSHLHLHPPFTFSPPNSPYISPPRG